MTMPIADMLAKVMQKPVETEAAPVKPIQVGKTEEQMRVSIALKGWTHHSVIRWNSGKVYYVLMNRQGTLYAIIYPDGDTKYQDSPWMHDKHGKAMNTYC